MSSLKGGLLFLRFACLLIFINFLTHHLILFCRLILVNGHFKIIKFYCEQAAAEKFMPPLEAREGLHMFMDDKTEVKVWRFRYRLGKKKENTFLWFLAFYFPEMGLNDVFLQVLAQ